ncbi:MAG: hypothetical protein K1X88_03660 [Nannocystaceae bacterium]|nr:hypothetical protein [Nannocystaceae bacterium]
MIAAAILAIALVGGARSEEPAAVEAAPAQGDDVMARAQSLYDAGLGSYETFDYATAITKWTEAYRMLPRTPETAASRNSLVYNIARAQERAFEQDGDVARLSVAISLLQRYIEDAEATATDPEAAASDIAEARTRIGELQVRMDEAKAAQKPKSEPAQTDRGRKPGSGLIGAGATLLVLGAGTLAGGIAAGASMASKAEGELPGLDSLGDETRRQQVLREGHRGDALVIGAAVAGGVVAVTGIVLVAVGAKRRRSASRRSAWLPMPTRHGGALTWTMHF